jgi:hypothetical protein
MLEMLTKLGTVLGLVLGTVAAISWHYGFQSVVIGFLVLAVTRIEVGRMFHESVDLLNNDPNVWPPRSTTDPEEH